MNYDDNAERMGERVQASTQLAIPRSQMDETLSPSARDENRSIGATTSLSEQADRIETLEALYCASTCSHRTITSSSLSSIRWYPLNHSSG